MEYFGLFLKGDESFVRLFKISPAQIYAENLLAELENL